MSSAGSISTSLSIISELILLFLINKIVVIIVSTTTSSTIHTISVAGTFLILIGIFHIDVIGLKINIIIFGIFFKRKRKSLILGIMGVVVRIVKSTNRPRAIFHETDRVADQRLQLVESHATKLLKLSDKIQQQLPKLEDRITCGVCLLQESLRLHNNRSNNNSSFLAVMCFLKKRNAKTLK